MTTFHMDETLWRWKKEKDVLVPVNTDKVSVHKRIKKKFVREVHYFNFIFLPKNFIMFQSLIYLFIYFRSGSCTSAHF